MWNAAGCTEMGWTVLLPWIFILEKKKKKGKLFIPVMSYRVQLKSKLLISLPLCLLVAESKINLSKLSGIFSVPSNAKLIHIF